MKLKMKLRLLNWVFGNFITLLLLTLLPLFIILLYYTYVNPRANATFLQIGLSLFLIFHLFNMCHLSCGLGYKIFKRYIKYVCGGCRQYRIAKLTKCLVENIIYYGPSGCLERAEKTKTELCKDCLKEAKEDKKLIRIYK